MTTAITAPTLTEAEWTALQRAEDRLYAGDRYVHSYTDVVDREQGGLADALWADARAYVETISEPGEYRIDEIARRVAAALAVLVYGPEFIAEKAEARS